MITRYQRLSFIYGVPGIVLEIAGRVAGIVNITPADDEQIAPNPLLTSISWAAMIAGTALLLIAFAYFAKAKQQPLAWCLLAFFPIIGVVVLLCLKDNAKGYDRKAPAMPVTHTSRK